MILPREAFYRTTLDLEQIDPTPRERRQCMMERCSPVLKLEDQRELVRLIVNARLAAQKDKARIVLAVILYMLTQNDAAIDLRGALSGNCCAGAIATLDDVRHAARSIVSYNPLDL